MNTTRRYVQILDAEECRGIARDYAEYERVGAIGDGPLREHSMRLMLPVGTEGSLTIMMDRLATEVWRRFAYSTDSLGSES